MPESDASRKRSRSPSDSEQQAKNHKRANTGLANAQLPDESVSEFVTVDRHRRFKSSIVNFPLLTSVCSQN